MPKVQPTGNGGHGRSGRGMRVTSSLAEINVVPLVDVMLVLLIIFMVAAPMIERGVEVKLPISSRSTRIEGERLILTIPSSYATDRVVYLGDEKLPASVLQERIRQQMQTVERKQVFLRGDGSITYQQLVGVMDMLKAGGVEDVGLETEIPPRSAR